MRHLQIISTCIFTALVFVSANAQAAGIGAMLGTGSESWDYDTGFSEDRSNGHFSFVYDTNVSQDRLYGYRLTLGTGYNDSNSSGGLDMDGFNMTHTFAFQVVHQQMFKAWIGPQIKITSYDSHKDQSSFSYEGTITGFGVGPAFGFNLNFAPPVSLNFTAGFHRMNYFGFLDIYDSTGFYWGEAEIDAEATGTFIEFAVLYRLGE